MDTLQSQYDELYVYSMGRAGFILQHVVDAYGAQSATEATKPIRLVFSLVGLYLRVEKQYTGRQVQQAHMHLGKFKRRWPDIPLPIDRGSITPGDVLASPPGPDRDESIDAWCRSVWTAFRASHQTIAALLRECGLI